MLIDAVKRYEKLAKESEKILPDGEAIVIELKPFKFKKCCHQQQSTYKMNYFDTIRKYNKVAADVLDEIVGTSNISFGVLSYEKISLIVEGKENNTFYGRNAVKIASLYASMVAKCFASRNLPLAFTADSFSISNDEINEYIDVLNRSNERTIINKITDTFIEKKKIVKTPEELEELLLTKGLTVDVRSFINSSSKVVEHWS